MIADYTDIFCSNRLPVENRRLMYGIIKADVIDSNIWQTKLYVSVVLAG